MYINSVNIEGFRNYGLQNVELSPGINVFYGNNAQGKTNFLEAVYICAMGKSFKFLKEKNLINFGSEFARVSVDYISDGMERTNSVLIKPDSKQIKVNETVIKKRLDLIGRLNVILFTPQELSIIKDGPAVRRKFIDLCAGQLRKKYLFALSQYNKVLAQKSKLLKDGYDSSLYVWNEQLAEYGSTIMWYRASLINKIKEMIEPIYNEITEKNEKLGIAYIKSIDFKDDFDQFRIKQHYMYHIQNISDREKEEKVCLIGPHRDDIMFYINGKNAREFASQGQQRSIVLSLKLVEAELFKEQTGEYPVMLLDDIASELDIERRKFLFSKIKDKQVIITCTDGDKLNIEGKASYFYVENGKISCGNGS